MHSPTMDQSKMFGLPEIPLALGLLNLRTGVMLKMQCEDLMEEKSMGVEFELRCLILRR